MKLVLVLGILLQFTPIYAGERLPMTQRTTVTERTTKPARPAAKSPTWKFGLLGLAGLSFLIRKRL